MQVLLTRTPQIASWAIRARLRETFSHAMGVEFDNPGRIIDATLTHGGVRRRPLGEALAAVDQVLELVVPLPDERSGLAFARSQLGAGYDWRAIGSFGIGTRDWQDPRRWFCFELIAAWWAAGGIPDFEGLPFVTGDHLIEVARKYGVVRPRRLWLEPIAYPTAPNTPRKT